MVELDIVRVDQVVERFLLLCLAHELNLTILTVNELCHFYLAILFDDALDRRNLVGVSGRAAWVGDHS
ncbi:hypothetical protein [Microbacterium profundi]